MKNFRISYNPANSDIPLTPEGVFILSDQLSQLEMRTFAKGHTSKFGVEEEVAAIDKVKQASAAILADREVQTWLQKSFYVDGAIKFSEDDLKEIEKMFVKFDAQGKSLGHDSEMFETYMLNLLNDLVYFKGSELVFRNEKYYFQFPSVKVDRKGRFTSVNDFDVLDVDKAGFRKDFLRQYNVIDQHILLFSTYYASLAMQGIAANVWAFSREISNLLTPKIIKDLQKALENTQSTGNPEIDRHINEQCVTTLRWLEYFRDLVNVFARDTSYHNFRHILKFISDQSLLIQHARTTFGIDIDPIFNQYLKVAPSAPAQKMLLGLIDAKVNMVAFMQNLTQLLLSPQFLDPDYEGKLVFDHSTVRNIMKTCPKEFAQFKALQSKLSSDEDSKYALLSVLDSHVGYFMDVMLGNNDIGYAKLIWELPDGLPEINTGKTDMMRVEMRDGIEILESYLDLMQSFVAAWAKDAIKKDKIVPNKSIPIHQKALKKIIRLYREENDPLVMIKTAQNALNSIILKGYNPNKDVLHILGVNYGGSLTGLYAKYVFSKSANRWRIISNIWNVVYSIYDVQNANSFLKLADYPIAQILNHETMDDVTKSKMRDQNWLLIFDDNTNSGETLDNLRKRAQESGFYGRIDTFACRASHNMAKYRKAIPLEEVFDFIKHSAVQSRRTHVNSEGERYKELLGTIVGRRIHKIMNPKNDESKAE